MNEEEHPVLFSEFIASLLLAKKKLSCLEVSKIMSDFYNENPFTYIIEPNDDFSLLYNFVEIDDKNIALKDEYNYNSLIKINEKTTTIKDMLKEHSSSLVNRFLRNKENLPKVSFNCPAHGLVMSKSLRR